MSYETNLKAATGRTYQYGSITDERRDIDCQSCNDTDNTRNLACNCGETWRKCPIRVLTELAPNNSPKKPQRIHDANGVDKPPPKSRRLEFEPVVALGGVFSRGAIALPPNGKSAARFPHLVNTVATGLRVATG